MRWGVCFPLDILGAGAVKNKVTVTMVSGLSKCIIMSYFGKWDCKYSKLFCFTLGWRHFLKFLHIILIVIKQMSWLLVLPKVVCTVRCAFSFYIFFFYCNHCSTYGLITHVQSIIAIHITMEMHSCYGCTILKNIFYFTEHLLLTILKHLAFFQIS